MKRYGELSISQKDVIWSDIRFHGTLPNKICIYCRPVTHKGHRHMSSCRMFPHQPMMPGLCLCQADRFCGEYVARGLKTPPKYLLAH